MLDIKTVTGGPLDVNTYVVALDGAAECVLIEPGCGICRGQRCSLRKKGDCGSFDACTF